MRRWEGFTRALSPITVLAALLTLGATAALSIVSYQLDRHNQHRLLKLQVEQTATVLQAVLPAIETPLASAAGIAATNGGSPAAFRAYMSDYVGAPPKQFAGATLWRINGSVMRRLASTGQTLVLPSNASRMKSTLLDAAKKRAVMLLGPLAVKDPRPRVGYVYAANGYAVYSESLLPKDRHAVIQPGSPFSDLQFALYLGRSASADTLLEASVDSLPVSGDTAMATAPFGASALTLVARTDRPLSGGLSAALWWIVIFVGLLITVLVAATVEWLVRRRHQAEDVTVQTQVQLAEQRSLAQTLQHALLPERLPTIPGLDADVRYITGVEGVDIGGDWYDLLPLADHKVFFVIGDVSGRGLPAGTTMAALRFAIHAFIHEGHPPATVLDRLNGILDVGRDGQFATVLCGILDVDRHEVTVASAGHLPPLVVAGGGARTLDLPTGPPIGVANRRPYESVDIPIPAGATLLAFTDGLIERRGQALDDSLAHLQATIGSATSLAEVIDLIVPALTAGSYDDIAIMGVQWLS